MVIFEKKVKTNSDQNTPNCTVLKKNIGGARRRTPLPNPGDAPVSYVKSRKNWNNHEILELS